MLVYYPVWNSGRGDYGRIIMLSECGMFLEHDYMKFMAFEWNDVDGCSSCYFFHAAHNSQDCPMNTNHTLACIDNDSIWMRIE